jgi:CelD/BcsL family acetyltransferase involved in cellulose biosynthesis
MAPCVDLAALRAAGADAFAPLSANTRHQLRRSLRRYAEAGELSLTRARDTAEAHGFLDALAALHQARWQARGQPGAFADPRFLRFHRALLARALPRGEAELVRVAAGPQMIGYLYNFLWRGEVLAYQSGFAYPPDGQRKPGLTCHHLAIAAHLAAGAQVYDFLAGEDRYKTSLANAARRLHWLELGPRWRPRAIRARLKGAPLTGD